MPVQADEAEIRALVLAEDALLGALVQPHTIIAVSYTPPAGGDDGGDADDTGAPGGDDTGSGPSDTGS